MRPFLVFALVVMVVAATWVGLLPSAPLRQPLAFDHAKHAAVTCMLCHAGAAASARAGIPQTGLCLKCHATAPKTSGAQAFWSEGAAQATIPWVRVSRVPDHVYFSHQRHTGIAGLDCASCHADVGRRAAPPARMPIRLDMTACLDCHRREGASQDCAACHR